MLQFLCLALMMAYVSAQTAYMSCMTPDPIVYMNVNDCTGTDPCQVERGTTITVREQFEATFDSTSIINNISIQVGTRIIVVNNRNDCPTVLAPDACPLVTGQLYTTEYTFDIPSDVEPVIGLATIIRRDSTGQIITCTNVPFEVIA